MKRKVNLPDTSLEAKDRVHSNMLAAHYKKIMDALKILGTANYEKISIQAGFHDRNQVSRRLLEMVKLGIVAKTDLKSPTTSGRNAYNYTLAESKKSVSDMVDDIIHQCTKPPFKQQELF